VKKVKKKDPITFDIFDALNSKKKVNVTKPAMVLGSKIKPQIPIRNVLDSSAPSKRRGKEREKPRKKRPTKMKKLILLSRANKKAMREENQAICLEIQAESGLDNTPLSEPNSSIELCNEELPEKENKKLVTDYKCKEDAEDNNISATAEEIKTVAIPEQSVMDKAKLLLHSRKFRNYCDHELSKDIDELVIQLIQDIVRFQDRQFAKDPLKAKSKKRYVVGLREIKKFLQVKKITLLILAPDVETVQIKGGLDDTISELIRLAKENEIPYVFTMNRWRLGKTCLRKVPISGIGVLNHQGSDENYMKIKEVLPLLQLDYKSKLTQALKDVNAPKDLIEEFSTLLK
jgi:selenocysteine insertion sequence-binding protein 2